jgi:hypothetical protein
MRPPTLGAIECSIGLVVWLEGFLGNDVSRTRFFVGLGTEEECFILRWHIYLHVLAGGGLLNFTYIRRGV